MAWWTALEYQQYIIAICMRFHSELPLPQSSIPTITSLDPHQPFIQRGNPSTMSKLLAGALLSFSLGKVLANTLFATITAPIFSTSPTYGAHILNSGMRSFLNNFSPTQIQLLLPPMLSSYTARCKAQNIAPQILPIPNTSASGFWLGDPREARYHMLYIHGGGYVIPGSGNHIALAERLVTWSSQNLAVFCISYTLSPEAVYPLAISQCVEALRYLLSLSNTKPSTTLIAGDSAGGALALAVLSHISNHPHPNTAVVKPLKVDSKLKAAILIDPFIAYPVSNNRDNFDRSAAENWLRTYRGGADVRDDEYILPATANAQWWEGTMVDHVWASAGEYEALRGGIEEWVERFREGMGGAKDGEQVLRFVVGEKEIHIAPVMSPYGEERLDELGGRVQEGALRQYIRETLVK